MESHLIVEDMKDLWEYQPPKKIPKKHASKIFYDPKEFNNEHKPLLVEDYALEEPELQDYALMVTELRTKIAARGYEQIQREEELAPTHDLESKKPPARTYRYQLMSTKNWQKASIDANHDYRELSCL
jgi:hypothetical protein